MASKSDSGGGWDSREALFLGLHNRHSAPGAGSPDIFLPDADLSRTWAHDHRAHPRTPGNLRTGNRAEAQNQPAQWGTHVSHPRAFLAGVSPSGAAAPPPVLLSLPLGI